MECSEYEKTTFIVLNVINNAVVTVTFEEFKFRFYVAKKCGMLDAIISTKDGYIECSNQLGKFLYIFVGRENFYINSKREIRLETNFYFIADRKFDDLSKNEFSFKFSGGIINKVYPPYSAYIVDDTEEQIIINKKDISTGLKMNILNKRAELLFGSCYCTEIINEKSINTTAGDSTLIVKGNFKINDLFRIEAELSRVFSFMAFRRVVNNYKINLVSNIQMDKNAVKDDVAICFYRTLSSNDGIGINKPAVSVLTIHKLQGERFKNLYKLINKTYKDCGFNIDFIVAEEKLKTVDKTRIKETVTTIECLLNRFKIYCKNTKTKALIKKLNKEIDIVKDKKIDTVIKNQLKNALGYANYPLKDRIHKLYKKEKAAVDGYLEVLKSGSLNLDFSNVEKIIIDTIDYRNKNTHNAIKYIDNSIIKGVVLFNAIIYSKVLRSIGFPPENIQWLLRECLE